MSNASLQEHELLRVGDLAARTGVNPRLLRYYENQGLIAAERSSAGQRLFEATAVEQVRYIRMLLEAGLPTRVIGELLGCIHDPGRVERCALPTLVEHLRAHDERIAKLLSTRDALQGLIDSSTPLHPPRCDRPDPRHVTDTPRRRSIQY
jgi:DNA-binding transcriptional MerR regulator